jgi:putative FmdB family regulatory protein
MPHYQYRCQQCQRRFEVFLSYSEYGQKVVVCPHCQSANVQRRIGRVRIARSEESRLDRLADPSALAGLDDDPRALGRIMREMGNEIGEDMGPEFSEVVDRLEAGQDPEDIEKALPDLGGDEGTGGGGFDDFD